MQHLDLERIASFDHEAPTIDELAHLSECRLCRGERARMIELSQLVLHAVTDVPVKEMPRLTSWDKLSASLRAEGLITSALTPGDLEASTSGSAVSNQTPKVLPLAEWIAANARGSLSTAPSVVATDTWSARAKPRNRTEWWRAAAAALVLLAGGGALGRVSAGAPVIPRNSQLVSNPSVAGPSVPGTDLGNTAFRSLDEANRVLETAQKNYEKASIFLAANDTTAKSTEMLRNRLAALDQMVAASRAGLESAPADPVLNHYNYAARAMRQATLQQLGGALPVGRSIETF